MMVFVGIKVVEIEVSFDQRFVIVFFCGENSLDILVFDGEGMIKLDLL